MGQKRRFYLSSLVIAQTRATTQPTNVQPRKIFKTNMASLFPLFLEKATMVGRKYRPATIKMPRNVPMFIFYIIQF